MRPAAATTLSLACLALGACGIFNSGPESRSDHPFGPISTGIPPSDGPRGAPPESSDPAPLVEADSVVIHSLTRIGSDASGAPAILLHLDIHDRFDQSIKAFGTLRAQLVTHGATLPDAPDEDGRIWDVDLRNPEVNALMYDDLVTRTYTIPLGGLPDWLIAWSREKHTDDPTVPHPARPDLRVWFTLSAGGHERVLRASRRLDP